MTARQEGHDAGVADARKAWATGFFGGENKRRLPGNHFDAQDWLAGYAAGLAEYNRSIEVAPPPLRSVTGYPFDGYDGTDESFERLLAGGENHAEAA